MFSKIVPAFTTDNISALGPLCLVAVLYLAIGIVLAWIVRTFFWVPHRFRHGILVAGAWGNWGDIREQSKTHGTPLFSLFRLAHPVACSPQHLAY
jgi:predicted permease